MRAAVRHIAVLALFAALAVAMTWPLAANLSLATAHPGDPFINAWILDWVYHAVTTDAPLWDANIFHPARSTLAFSENLFGIALVLAPLLASDLSRLTIVNIALLIGFATAGYAAAALGRHLTGSWTAGIAAGIFFAFLPWRFTHLTHLQHEWTLWMPLALLALLRLHERTSIANAALLAGALLMNGLTNLHWFVFGSVAIGVAALVLGRSVRFFTVSGCAALVALLPMIPVLLPYRHAQALYGMRGDAGETLAYSARAGDWLLPSLHNRIYGPFNDGSVDPERWLFPGVLAIVLALLALRARDRFVATGFAVAGNGAKALIVHYDRLGDREPIVRAWLAREQLQPVYAGPFVEAFALDPAVAPAAVPRVQASELTGQLLHPRHLAARERAAGSGRVGTRPAVCRARRPPLRQSTGAHPRHPPRRSLHRHHSAAAVEHPRRYRPAGRDHRCGRPRAPPAAGLAPLETGGRPASRESTSADGRSGSIPNAMSRLLFTLLSVLGRNSIPAALVVLRDWNAANAMLLYLGENIASVFLTWLTIRFTPLGAAERKNLLSTFLLVAVPFTFGAALIGAFVVHVRTEYTVDPRELSAGLALMLAFQLIAFVANLRRARTATLQEAETMATDVLGRVFLLAFAIWAGIFCVIFFSGAFFLPFALLKAVVDLGSLRGIRKRSDAAGA